MQRTTAHLLERRDPGTRCCNADAVSAAQASTNYVVNALAVTHALLKATDEMTTMQLHQALMAEEVTLACGPELPRAVAGKAEAVARGDGLREIEARARRIAADDRPACSVCVTDVTR
jgi:hypothetical protein